MGAASDQKQGCDFPTETQMLNVTVVEPVAPERMALACEGRGPHGHRRAWAQELGGAGHCVQRALRSLSSGRAHSWSACELWTLLLGGVLSTEGAQVIGTGRRRR